MVGGERGAVGEKSDLFLGLLSVGNEVPLEKNEGDREDPSSV